MIFIKTLLLERSPFNGNLKILNKIGKKKQKHLPNVVSFKNENAFLIQKTKTC